VGTHIKIAILEQLQTHFEAKHEKGVATQLPHVPPNYTPFRKPFGVSRVVPYPLACAAGLHAVTCVVNGAFW